MPKTFAECQDYRDTTPRYDMRFMNYNFATNAEVMLHRANYLMVGSLDHRDALPEDLDITERFPGVDPKGMFCDVDMGFMQRLNQVKLAASLCSLAHQSAIGHIFKNLGDPDSSLHRQVLRPMQETASEIRLMDRAQKLAFTQQDWDAMDASHLRNSQSVQHFEALVSNMEYAVGLREQPTFDNVNRLTQSDMSSPEPPHTYANDLSNLTGLWKRDLDLLHQASDQISPRPNLNIPYPNMQNILQQRYHAHPSNFYKEPDQAPTDYRTPAVAEKAVASAVTGAAKYSLDAMYKKIEGRHPSSRHPEVPNRGTLITVDGKTVAQRMAEEYKSDRSRLPEHYNQWYKENLDTKSAEYVSAGLMAGKRVESFLPDAEGKLPDTPTVITKTGVEPTPLEPVTFNAWERFFSKHGFYKGKVAQQEEYNHVMEGRKTVADTMKETALKQEIVANRDAMAERSEAALAFKRAPIRKSFIGDHLNEDNKPKASSVGELQLGRTNPVTACMCKMAADGHSFEDIIDPTKLQAEKKAVGDYYAAVATGKTPPVLATGEGTPPETLDQGAENIGKWMYNGQKVILDRLNAEMAGVNFQTLDQHPSFPVWNNMAHAAFDASQNKSSSFRFTNKGYHDAAEADFQNNPALRREMEAQNPALRNIPAGQALTDEQRQLCGCHIDDPINTLAQITGAYSAYLEVAAQPVSHPSLGHCVHKAVMANTLTAQVQDHQHYNPGAPCPTSHLLPMMDAAMLRQASHAMTADSSAARALCKGTPQEMLELDRSFSSGRLANALGGVNRSNLQSNLNDRMDFLRSTVASAARRHDDPPQANAPTQTATQATTEARGPRRR